ncbi:Pyrophosphatase PpaX [compost metagenome]
MIGDTTHDLQMAANAGAKGIGVCYGAHPADSLRAMAPVHCATSIPDLTDWLLAHA